MTGAGLQALSTSALSGRIGDPNLRIVDTRPLAAYRGWRLRDEARGGHIAGAVDFPIGWLDRLEPGQIDALLHAKDITPKQSVVVYGYRDDAAERLAAVLRARGGADISVYADGLAAWAADASLPMEHLPRYQQLIYPEWLRELATGGAPPTYAGNGFLLFEVGYHGEDDYTAGHIPGAIYLDTLALETSDTKNRRAPAELKQALQAHGITSGRTVVLYARDSTAAARAALILLYAGVADVRLLDGGFEAWQAAAYELETQANLPTPAGAFGVEIPQHPEYIVDIDAARTILAAADAELVSVRSWKEFIGDTSGYDYIGPQGRIAGAVWGHAGSDKDRVEDYRNLDDTMRNAEEVAANWRAWGVTPDKRIAFYCGTGWRASEAFINAYVMGWPNIAVYDGGWFEWSSDPANPVEQGVPGRGSS